MSTNPKPEKEKTPLDLETLVRFLHVFRTKSLRDLNGLGTVQNRTSIQIRCRGDVKRTNNSSTGSIAEQNPAANPTTSHNGDML